MNLPTKLVDRIEAEEGAAIAAIPPELVSPTDVVTGDLLEVPPGMEPPSATGSEWIDAKTGWIYRRLEDSRVMKVRPSSDQMLQDVMRLRLLSADPGITKTVIIQRTGWPSAYLRQVRDRLAVWEEAHVSRSAGDAILSQGLARMEKAVAGLFELVAMEGVAPGVRARAYRDIAAIGARMVELGQEAGIVKRVASEVSVTGRHLHIHATPEEAAERKELNSVVLQKFVFSDGTVRRSTIAPPLVLDATLDANEPHAED